jgi:hypothetical protein
MRKAAPWSQMVLALIFGLLSLAPGAQAGPLVSGNPHINNLPTGTTPPLPGIAGSAWTEINAYHVSSQAEVNRALAYNNYNKPKILSDDAGGVTVPEAESWIDQACAHGVHYEHWDAAMLTKATSGVVIDSIDDFEGDSVQILNYIRDHSCASILTPNGTLTRGTGANSTKLYWNGAPINLVGFGWTGVLVGNNFKFNPYLDVLHDHHVNLIRVWIIDQWTALSVDQAGAPHLENANLPFKGTIDFNGSTDTLDIMQVKPAFITRLVNFVDKAAARGIVVQLSLFDRHGVRNISGSYGNWLGSPYNKDNNKNGILLPGGANAAAPGFLGVIPPAGQNPPANTIAASHAALVRAIYQAVASKGNVILEIMNEPLAAEWGEQPITDWHNWIGQLAHGG